MASAPKERLIERALTLIVEQDSAPPDSARAAALALHQWGGRSEEHDAAVNEARRRWEALGGMAESLRSHFGDSTPHGDSPPVGALGHGRRKLLLSVAALLGTGTLAGRGLWWHWQQPVFSQAYRTQVAQMLQVVLPDGPDKMSSSRIDLAPQTSIAVSLYRQRRLINMDGGEARFDVARDDDRPFVAMTREARIEVVGTVFTVRDRGGSVTVGVERGHVRVQVFSGQNADLPPSVGTAIDLRPGQALDIRDGQVDTPRHVDPVALSAWRNGWLVFENAPLGEALATINAYRVSPITSADPRVATLRLSGRFRANDSAGLLAVLPTILPLTARALPDGRVELQTR